VGEFGCDEEILLMMLKILEERGKEGKE